MSRTSDRSGCKVISGSAAVLLIACLTVAAPQAQQLLLTAPQVQEVLPPVPGRKPPPPSTEQDLIGEMTRPRAAFLFEGRIGDAATGEGVVILGSEAGNELTLDLLRELGIDQSSGVSILQTSGTDSGIQDESQSARSLRDRRLAASGLIAKDPTLPLDYAQLRALDKITGRLTTLVAPVGQPVIFGKLSIIAETCQKNPPSEPPENAAFLVIDENQAATGTVRAFSGWMFASNPAISALDHPVYDVWVEKCRNDAG